MPSRAANAQPHGLATSEQRLQIIFLLFFFVFFFLSFNTHHLLCLILSVFVKS